MSFFWVIALVQAAWVGSIWFTGRINLVAWPVIDRDIEPRRFRFMFICFAASVPILILQALYAPFSN